MKSEKRKTGQIPKAYELTLAKWILIGLYLADDEFSAGFSRLRQQYISVLSGPDRKTTSGKYHDKYKEILENDDLDISDAWRFSNKGREPASVGTGINFKVGIIYLDPPDIEKNIRAMIGEIGSFAEQFGFDYPWALPTLLLVAVIDAVREVTRGRKITSERSFWNKDRGIILDLQKMAIYQQMAEFKRKWEPLRIEIPADIVQWVPINTILDNVRIFLRNYKENIGKSGIPQDTLRKHIGWVYANKRYKYSYREIMGSEYYGDKVVDYSQVAYATKKWDEAFSS